MIDTTTETLVTLKEAAQDFGGIAIPFNTLRNYVYLGVKGVKLETVLINKRYTSKEAIQRFIERKQGGEPVTKKSEPKRMTTGQTEEILRRHGIVG